MLRRVGRLTYELEIPAHWRVHAVFAIAMLEPAPAPGSDPFNRPIPDQPDSLYVEGDTDKHRSWEVERIIDRQGDRYLVRWRDWGPEYDEWRTKAQLRSASEVVKEYEERERTMRNQKARRLGLRIRPAPRAVQRPTA